MGQGNSRKFFPALFMAISTPRGKRVPMARDTTSIPSVESAGPLRIAIALLWPPVREKMETQPYIGVSLRCPHSSHDAAAALLVLGLPAQSMQ